MIILFTGYLNEHYLRDSHRATTTSWQISDYYFSLFPRNKTKETDTSVRKIILSLRIFYDVLL